MWDVVIIGAGISGLTAAQHLNQHGYRVLIIEKSRGLGGRLATRRIDNQPVDHGCRFFSPFEQDDSEILAQLLQREVLVPWNLSCYDLNAQGELYPCKDDGTYYVAPRGMTAVAKFLASNLTIHRRCRATRVQFNGASWTIQWENALGQTETTETRAVVAAIPAPQTLPLLGQSKQYSPMDPLLRGLATVEFDPVITVMAGYSLAETPVLSPNKNSTSGPSTHQPGWMIFGHHHATLRWIGLDSSKRSHPHHAVVVIHSTPGFASKFFGHPLLAEAGRALLNAAGSSLGAGFASPSWQQTHRWRYGFVRHPHNGDCFSQNDIPGFMACGDWCRGANVEAAFRSGRKAAENTMGFLN